MTAEFLFFKNPQQEIKFINKSVIPIPNMMLKHLSTCLETPIQPTFISLNSFDRQAR